MTRPGHRRRRYRQLSHILREILRPTMTNERSRLQISRGTHGQVVVLTLSGEMRMSDGDLALGRHMDEVLAAGGRSVVVDLANVSYIDSSGVGRLVAEAKRIRQHGGVLRLAGLTARSQQLLATLNLKALFQIYDDVEAAVRSFA
ncbi:MAG TPA: STAS domain-containing protein [Vicinamibacterales bacterium]|nr:STAS domain-containing protein [Vicinamibacterales bacterium]